MTYSIQLKRSIKGWRRRLVSIELSVRGLLFTGLIVGVLSYEVRLMAEPKFPSVTDQSHSSVNPLGPGKTIAVAVTGGSEGVLPYLVDKDGDSGDEAPKIEGFVDQDGLWRSHQLPADASLSIAKEVTGGLRVEDIVEPANTYRYAAFDKPDPFVPPIVEELAPEVVDPFEVPIISPLQQFRLEMLKLVGIWQKPSGERKAMIMAPANDQGNTQGIVVKRGDPIGNQGGRITVIGDRYLSVREFSLAPDGTRRFVDRQIFIGRQLDRGVAGKMVFTPDLKPAKVIADDQLPGAGPIGAALPLAGEAPRPNPVADGRLDGDQLPEVEVGDDAEPVGKAPPAGEDGPGLDQALQQPPGLENKIDDQIENKENLEKIQNLTPEIAILKDELPLRPAANLNQLQ